MKKILLSIAVSLLAVATFAAVTTNNIGQVVTTDANGVVTSITNPSAARVATNSIIGLVGIQISPAALSPADSAAALALKTPRDTGDILIFVNATSNRIWIANNTTNWLDLD